MLLERRYISCGVGGELTRLDLYLRLLADPPPIVYGVDVRGFRVLRAQVFKHGCLMRHLSVPDAEPQREFAVYILQGALRVTGLGENLKGQLENSRGLWIKGQIP
jgi:hypothetical protein